MKFTNEHNLPEALVRFITDDEYTIGNADFSFSTLNSPPQIRRLMSIHNDELVVDVSENLWMLFGTAIHKLLEDADRRAMRDKVEVEEDLKTETDRDADRKKFRLLEERMYMNVGGVIISGQTDKYNPITEVIDDYKTTSVYKVMMSDKDDWENQMNVYALLLEHNGHKVRGANIQAFLRDWREYDYDKDKTGKYPPIAFKKEGFVLWDRLTTLEFIIKRIRLHKSVENVESAEELYEKTPCTPKDRWANKPPVYKIFKQGAKRATNNGTFDDKAKADSFLLSKGVGYILKTILPESKRCKSCVVKKFCYQYNNIINPKLISSDKVEDSNVLFKELVMDVNEVNQPADVIVDPPDIFDPEYVDPKDVQIITQENAVDAGVSLPPDKPITDDLFKEIVEAKPIMEADDLMVGAEGLEVAPGDVNVDINEINAIAASLSEVTAQAKPTKVTPPKATDSEIDDLLGDLL